MSTDRVDAPTDRTQRLPDFLIVGHAKSGTTAMYEMLRRQPRIFMPEIKETWFFVPELRSRFRPERSAVRPDTLEEYRALFAPATADQLAGEATPSYLRSHDAARRIAEVQPDARIIAILREPASYLHSLHLQLVETHVETELDLRKAIALEQERKQGRAIPPRSPRPQSLNYSEHVRYAEQLRRYHDVFPREQVLVLIYEEFRRDNAATLRGVLEFLGIDDAAPIETLDANSTVRVRSLRMHELLRSLYLGDGAAMRVAKRTVKAFAPQGLRRAALRGTQRRLVFGAPRPPDPALMLELRRRFKGEVVALSDYLKRDLVTLWGYDDID